MNVNKELKFLKKIKKQIFFGGERGGPGGGGRVGGSGWM